MRAATVLRSVICRALAIVLAALAVLSSIAPVQAFAADSSQPVKTVRVGWLVNNEGFQDGTPGERLSGWGYEYLQTLSYYTPGWRYEYVTGTFTELMDMLEAGEIDLMPNISYSEERAQKLLFSSNPEGTERYYIYAKPDRDDLAKGDPQALQGLTIGCNPGVMQTFVGQQWLANEGIACTYREYDGDSVLFDALANNEVDAVIMNDTISSPSASPMFYIGSSDYYFAVPKSRPDLMNDINAAMTAIARVNPRYIDEVKSNYSAQSSGSSSLNGPERSWLKANGNTITLGYITGKLPYCNEDEDGEMEGSLASLATTLHDKFGITVKTVPFDSYKMMSKALSKGSIDVALPVYRDYWFAEQSGVVQSVSLGTVSLTAIHTDGNLNKDLQNIACTKSSFVNQNVLESLFPTATVTEYQSDDEAFDALRKGTVHCIVAPSSRVKTIGDRYDLEDCETVELPDTCELSCWISRGKTELLGIINKGIINAGESLSASSYSSTSYTAQESDTFQFLYRNRAAIVTVIICILLTSIVILAWSLQRAQKEQRKADAANAAKTAFLTRMSHDIRTPMNAIIGFSDLLEKHIDEKDRAVDYIAKIKSSSSFLLSLINYVLEMARIESGKASLKIELGSYSELINSLNAVFEPSLKSKNLSYLCYNTVEHDAILCDRTKIREILLNIISNSIKYTPEGGKISVKIEETPAPRKGFASYRITVKDNGIGMSKEYLPHIFEEFTREHSSTESHITGTGLGLPIVKSLVNLMGGTIDVESELGAGTITTICLTFELPTEEQLAAHQHKDEILEQSLQTLSEKRVLLAEDNDLNAEIVLTVLEENGIHAEHVKDGALCLKAVQNAPEDYYNVILMDIQMPNMNGYQAAEAIRALPGKRGEIPIVAMTANAFEEDRRKALESGMNAHIAKPVDVSVLLETLSRFS